MIIDPASASARLTDEECLSFYLRLDLSNGNVPNQTAIFGKRSGLGRSLVSPPFIRGVSKDPFVVVRHWHWFASLKNEDQKRLKSIHFTSLPPAERKLKLNLNNKNIKYLCKRSTKDSAIISLEEGTGETIAHDVGYIFTEDAEYSDSEDESNLDEGREGDDCDNEEGDNEEEEAILEHVGAGSSQELIDEFTRKRMAALKKKRFRKRMKNAPKSHAELCHAGNIESEHSVFKRFAKHLDSTFVQNVSAEVAANAPIRSGILLYVNEVRTNSNAGGRISKKLRSEKTQLILIANNSAESKRILRHLRMSQLDEHKDKYEFISLGRDKDAENSTMVDAISKFTEGTLNARSNPSMRQQSLEDITNRISSARTAGVARGTRHSI